MNTIHVGPDGTEFEFLEGTPQHVISAAIARHYGNQPEAQRDRLHATTALTAPRHRSAGERFADVWSQTVNTSWIAEGWRAGFNDAAEYQAAGRAHKEGEPIPDPAGFVLNPSRLIARLVSSGYMGFDAVTGRDTLANVTNEMVQDERARRAEFARESSEDPFWEAEGGVGGKALHGAAALTATLVGAATDPTSYITGGSSIWGKIAVQAAVAGGVDVLAQADALGLTQDEYRIEQTLLSAGAGAAFTGAFEGAAKLIRKPGATPPSNDTIAQAMREDLDAADAVTRPLLTTDDIKTTPLPDGMPLKDVTPPKDASVPARVEGDARIDGPEVKSSEDVKAEAGAKADAPEADPWNGVDWDKVGTTNRGKAAMAHLDRLKTFIKKDQIETFVRWLGKESVDLGDNASHWNRDVFDFDALNNDPDKFEEVTNVMADIFRPLYDAAGREKKTWDDTIKRQTLFGITLSDAIKAHSDLTGEGGAAAKIHALETVAIQQTDELLGAITKLETEIKAGKKDTATIEAVAAQLQAASLLDSMAGGAKSEIGRALNIMKAQKKRARMVNDIQESWRAMQDSLGTADLSDEALAAALKRMREAYGEGGAAKVREELRTIRKLGLRDYLSTYIVTGYLSNPATAVRNAIGSVLHATMTVAERYVAAGVTSPIRRGVLGKRTSAEAVTFREANAYVHGVHQNFMDASRMAWQAFKDAKPITDAATSIGDTAQIVPFAFNAARRANWRKQGVLAIPDMAGTALFGTLRTLGVRPSLAMDEFTKVMGRGMQLNALAVREAAYRSARLGAAESSITSEATARTTADATFAQTLSLLGSKTANGTAFVLDQAKTMVSPTETLGQKFTAILSQAASGAQAQVAAETTARTTAIAAEASARQALATQVAANLSAAINSEQSARSTAISAETLARQQLATQVGQNTAAIQNEASARSTADQTFAQQFSLLGATAANGSAWNMNMNTVQIGGGMSMATRLSGIDTALGNNSAAIANEITARTNAVSSVAQSLQTVNSTVGSLSASVTTLSAATNGVLSRWGVAVNNNGHIIGISLNNSGPAAGSLNMVADEFAFVSPNGGTPVKIVSMNGNKVRFNTNVEMGGDLLVEGTIHNSKLTQNTVTNVEAAYNAGAVTLTNTTPCRIHGVWINVEKPSSPIDVDFNAYGTFTHNASGSFVAIVQLVRSRGTDGGTVIQTVQLNGSGMANDTWQGALPMKYLDRPNEAGSWHYYVQIYFTSNMSTQTVTARYGKVTEMKNNTSALGGGTGSGAGVGTGGGGGGGGGGGYTDPGYDPGGGGGYTDQPTTT